MSFCYIQEGKKMKSPIHWINHYPGDITICFPDTYPLIGD